ncbi:sugar transferase [Pleomorphomonas sp. PLEO]|uniref:sugar transferase n=1 Tax=Pleomorphomonas sp. PLEO TaxID=3239306 RepID=UPI00351EEA8B
MTEFIDDTAHVTIDRPAAIKSWTKRALDILGAAASLVLLAPLLVLVAALIRLDSPGPVLFPQDRYGLGGRTFRIYKFRTMTATASREAFRQAAVGDARITRLGNILRLTSIDELPQLFNVLVGDMSLIGPRPHPLALDEHYRQVIPGYMSRYAVRPGMSGLAQVTGHRGPTPTTESMAARVAQDLRYIDTWSFALDLLIVVATVLPWWSPWRSEVRGGA